MTRLKHKTGEKTTFLIHPTHFCVDACFAVGRINWIITGYVYTHSEDSKQWFLLKAIAPVLRLQQK